MRAETPPAAAPRPEPAAYDAADIARLLGCSVRHVRRLHDAGRMPSGFRLGRLVRWPRAAIDEWISGGCRSVR